VISLATISALVVANAVTDATAWLEEFSSQWQFLVIIFVIAFLDSVLPIVPSETMVIIGGVAAGVGEQPILAVIAAGAVGAALGDSSAYFIGARLRGLVKRRADRSAKLAARLEWADTQIVRRGGPLLVTARFIPGGRTALTVSCGVTGQPRPWFFGWVAVAVSIWATYAAVLGYVFGETFDHTTALILAFVTAIAINVAIEVVRHRRARRH
jgi:membrane protein DedA with SNARE-associated domain